MRKCICVLFCIQMLFRASSVALAEPPQPALAAFMDTQGFLDSLGDWILGSDWGILRGSIDPEGRTVTLFLPQDSLDALTEQDRDDIRGAMLDMLSRALPSREAARGFEILFRAEGAPEAKRPDGSAARPPAGAEKAVRNLVFIHHSVGENWLREGLANALNARGYHVADITYGWREVGDRTDTADWPTWFTDGVMAQVYGELGAMSAQNSIAPADGENTVVLFKSCFPNSDVGESIKDERAVYNSLLPYFQRRPDKLFILVTPPPMVRISTPAMTRSLCRWLTDRERGWLAKLSTGNVFVFDLYNVLTHPDAHHHMQKGVEVHTEVPGADTLRYDSGGDDHPNLQGNLKATEEFVPLLEYWVSLYGSGGGRGFQLFEP